MTENKDLTFEQALARLEEIVRGMESGSLPLDDTVKLFEEGNALVKLCNEKLDAASQKVKILTETPLGVTEEDFDA